MLVPVGPTWPPSLPDYEHLRSHGKPDFSWELLRRNRDYQSEALATAPSSSRQQSLPSGARIMEMLEAAPSRTNYWGLRPFC